MKWTKLTAVVCDFANSTKRTWLAFAINSKIGNLVVRMRI